jgi:hypothetical protein
LSPQLKLLLQGFAYAVRLVAKQTTTTWDDQFADFLDLALSNPAQAQHQLAIGKAGAAAAEQAAAKIPADEGEKKTAKKSG